MSNETLEQIVAEMHREGVRLMDARLASYADRIERAAARGGEDAERMEDALEQIKQWAQAYPLAVFPEPDFAKAHELLKAGGMTLDAISASNMRHVITQVQKIVDAAMSGEAKDDNVRDAGPTPFAGRTTRRT